MVKLNRVLALDGIPSLQQAGRALWCRTNSTPSPSYFGKERPFLLAGKGLSPHFFTDVKKPYSILNRAFLLDDIVHGLAPSISFPEQLPSCRPWQVRSFLGRSSRRTSAAALALALALAD
jgi:hypothetical protein